MIGKINNFPTDNIENIRDKELGYIEKITAKISVTDINTTTINKYSLKLFESIK